MLGFFNPLPPCPHLGLIYSTKFTQNLPYYIFFWANPPSPSVRTSYMDAPLQYSLSNSCKSCNTE